MNIASDDIDSFQYRMEDIILKDSIGTGSYGKLVALCLDCHFAHCHVYPLS